MSWFKRSKNDNLIPPVAEPPALRSGSSAPPSYRSGASTYVASRDGDLSDPAAYGAYGERYGPKFSNMRANSGGYGSNGNYREASAPAQDYNSSYPNRGGYGSGGGGVNELQALVERDLEADRNYPEQRNRYQDGPPGSLDGPPAEEQEEEDVEAIKAKTRFLKQDTVAATRDALRMAREAEETGRSTLLRLGEQSEKIASTERHLDVSKGHSLRAEDNTNEIKSLNRSIFIPSVTFSSTKNKRRIAQEQQREQRFQEDMTERERALRDIRESENRLGRVGAYGDDGDDERIGGSRQQSESELALRKEQRKRYQFEAGDSDDELEQELEDNMDALLQSTKKLTTLGLTMGEELDKQNKRLERVTDKTERLTLRVDNNVAKLKSIR